MGLGQANDHVVVLGIGGSALGARALLAALLMSAVGIVCGAFALLVTLQRRTMRLKGAARS